MQTNPPPGISLSNNDDSLQTWTIGMSGAKATIYEGEDFRLRFVFAESYPLESPQVVFLDPVVRLLFDFLRVER